ncbi:MAG: hypothetical protein K6E78_02345 [Treponema sp.]|nr:hypothetical protein [Treponema sp.]
MKGKDSIVFCKFIKDTKNIFISAISCLFALLLSSCLSLRFHSLPYEIIFQKDYFEEGDFSLTFTFTSFSPKDAASFYLALSVCDQDGNSVLKGGEEIFCFGHVSDSENEKKLGEVSELFSAFLGQRGRGEFTIDFEDYLLPDCEGPFFLESLNVIKIEYLDGEIWEENGYF